MTRGYVLVVAFPDEPESHSALRVVNVKRYLESVGAEYTLHPLRDDTPTRSPLHRIRAAAARMFRLEFPQEVEAPVPPVKIDMSAHLVYVDRARVVLAEREWELLEALIVAGPEGVRAQDVADRYWPDATNGTQNARTIMFRLRMKLDAASPLVQTIKGVGWCLRPAVNTVIERAGVAA